MLPQLGRGLVVEEVPVGEDLEVAVGVRLEQLEDLRVHEGLAAEEAEEAVAVLLGVRDQA